MSDVQLPLPPELMLPTLRSVIELGGSAPYSEIDDKALEVAGITEAQKSVLYESDATATGPKILHRIAWARTMLKRIGALEGAGYGIWAATGYGIELGTLIDVEARSLIDAALSQAFEPVEPNAEQLDQFRKSAESGTPVSMSVRELIKLWGVNRRRTSTVERVNTTLASRGLTTNPYFTIGGLESVVELVLDHAGELAGAVTPEGEEPQDAAPIGFVVGNIPSATAGIASVNPKNDDLLTARSKMQAGDYSQLAVMEGEHKLKGAVTWESIAKAVQFNPEATLVDCIDPNPKEVRLDQSLLDAVPDISSAGFVFVRGEKNKITGIITAADLSDQFALLSRPFLLIGELERLLRSAIDRCFSAGSLFEATDPDDEREVDGAGSLSLGEVQRLLEDASGFEQLGWAADRQVFISGLDRIRMIRNEVMHFSPDPIAADEIAHLRTFAAWIRTLEKQVATF